MDKYLIDTNIIIYYLEDKIPEFALNKLERILLESFNVSTINRIELLGWTSITESEKVQLEDFLQAATVFYVDIDIEKKAIDIRQKHTIKTPDALIAATALVHDFTLVTRNEKDFQHIEGLLIYNPFHETNPTSSAAS